MQRFESDQEGYMFYKKYKAKKGKRVLDDFVHLNVYWLDNKVVTTEESALYSLPSLISDIGGQFGIWIGVSVITLSELMELIFSTCVGVFRRKTKKEEDAEVGNTSDKLEEPEDSEVKDKDAEENKDAEDKDKDAEDGDRDAEEKNKDAEDKDKNAEDGDKDDGTFTGVAVE